MSRDIKLIGEGLHIGETIREVCPTCGGGSSREKSLVVTRDDSGTLLWICHRASCSTKGNNSSQNYPILSTNPQPTKKARKKFTGTTVPLREKHLEIIYKRWGIHEPQHWYWTPSHGGRVAMSIRSPKYTHRGWVLRDIMNRSPIKTLTYVDDGEEGISWYREHLTADTVVVEDIPSAVRASRYVNAVALLGTGVGLTRAQEIAEYSTGRVTIALDQDATSQAFKLARRYAGLWGDVGVLMLEKDIKDMKEEEVKKLLGVN